VVLRRRERRGVDNVTAVGTVDNDVDRAVGVGAGDRRAVECQLTTDGAERDRVVGGITAYGERPVGEAAAAASAARLRNCIIMASKWESLGGTRRLSQVRGASDPKDAAFMDPFQRTAVA
jgi:hypothetical protein